MNFQFNSIQKKSYAIKSDSCFKIHSYSMERLASNIRMYQDIYRRRRETGERVHWMLIILSNNFHKGYDHKVSEKGSNIL